MRCAIFNSPFIVLLKKTNLNDLPSVNVCATTNNNNEGDLLDEDQVLEFLTSLEAMDLPDQIEEVNAKILDKIIHDTNYVAVLFCKSVAYAFFFLKSFFYSKVGSWIDRPW